MLNEMDFVEAEGACARSAIFYVLYKKCATNIE